MDKLKLIKTIVFFITFLLILGTISLLGIIYKKSTQENKSLPIDINLQENKDSNIASFTVENGNIYILVKSPKETDKIIIIREGSATPEEIRLH